MAAQKTVPFAKIDMNAGTQTRAKVRNDVIEEYAECAGQLPPVVLFTEDGVTYFPGAGFHRIPAFVKAGRTEIPAEVRKGGRREALLFSAGDNHDHGVRRTAEDKRNAVKMLLQDAEWNGRSDNWIAEACKVSNHLVADVRADSAQKEEPNGDSTWHSPSSCEPRASKDGKSRPAKMSVPLCERCVRIGARTPPECANCNEMEDGKKREAEEEKQRKAAEAKAERERKAAERQAAEDKKKADKEAEREAREAAKKAEAKRKKEAAAERERERMAAQKARDQEREEKRHKNGQEKFNYRDFQKDFGMVVRWCDRLANAYQAKESPDHQRCQKHLSNFLTEMEKWYSKLTSRPKSMSPL